MSTLLLGTDFSTRSDRAMRRALLLARQANYELLLVHVIEQEDSESADERYFEARELLAGIRRSAAELEKVECQTAVRRGRAGDELTEAAREAKAEAILIGPHRKAPLRDWISGSTAEAIIAKAEVPLIVSNAVPAEPYRRYLLPVDFGSAAAPAARAALDLPFVTEPQLVFVHVFDAEAREMLGRAFVQGREKEEYVRVEGRSAREKLARFVEELGCSRAKLAVRETSGSIAADVVRAGRDEDADLIIVASSNKGVLEAAMVGSVTEEILRSEHHDIMVVPQHLILERPGD